MVVHEILPFSGDFAAVEDRVLGPPASCSPYAVELNSHSLVF